MTGWRRSGSSLVSGVVLLDKPVGVSSFAALRAVKTAAGTRKVGHTGTLDPFASGLLVALVGPATRLARYFNGLDKTYVTRFAFGSRTDTDDSTGTVVASCPPPALDLVRSLVTRYTGEFEQVPPRFSAVHVNGRRAYEIARSGFEPEIPRRRVTVHRFRVLEIGDAGLSAEIACSAGTYIRSIARDLAAEAGSCGHVDSLRRTEVGPFRVSDAVGPQDFSAERDLHNVVPLLKRLPQIRTWDVDNQDAVDAMHGRVPRGAKACPTREAEVPIALVHNDELLAVGRWHDGRWSYDLVIPNERS